MHDALCRNRTLIKGHTHEGNKMQQCNCDMPNLVEHCPAPSCCLPLIYVIAALLTFITVKVPTNVYYTGFGHYIMYNK